MIFSRSSTAIWYVSRSESFEREVRILCFSSTMAKWVEREEETEEEEDFEEEFGGCCGWDVGAFEVDGFGGFVGFELLGPAKLMFSSCWFWFFKWEDVKWKWVFSDSKI